jgi:hypothetical protein
MAYPYFLDLAFVLLFIIATSIFLHQLKFSGTPHQFISILEQQEQSPEPYLKGLHDEKICPLLERYLLVTGALHQKRPKFVRLQVFGSEYRESEAGSYSLSGTTYYSLIKPGFLSRSRIHKNVLLWIDSTWLYSFYSGSISRRICSILPKSCAYSHTLNRNSLIRYICEAVWYPWALEPSPFIRWTTIDDKTSRLTVSFHHFPIHFFVVFSQDGFIEKISKVGKYQTEEGLVRSFTLEARYNHYFHSGGVYVPKETAIEWETPEGDRIIQYQEIKKISFSP